MPYRYLPDIAIADVAFQATADSLEGLFLAAADATMNAMVADLEAIGATETRILQVQDPEPDMLLFQLLQELLFYKDAERLLLRVREVRIEARPDGYSLKAEASGETIDPSRHDLLTDVKAVTLYRLRVARAEPGWEATVVLDV